MTKTINLLADDEISEWWDDPSNKTDRQERLRQAVKIGLAVLGGTLATIDAKDKELIDALQRLINSGVAIVAKGSVDSSLLVPAEMPRTPMKPDLKLLRKVRDRS